MNVCPGWERKIVAYLDRFTWWTPEAVRFERSRGTRILERANPYTWNMCVNRAAAGQDIPSWLALHVEAEIQLRRAG